MGLSGYLSRERTFARPEYPLKVVSTALLNAASLAGLIIMT
ncbi:hypothetical protein [Mesorhizobium sp. GR13]|nr:hypothetical protein [Mesorhizobium sp. GR13]